MASRAPSGRSGRRQNPSSSSTTPGPCCRRWRTRESRWRRGSGWEGRWGPPPRQTAALQKLTPASWAGCSSNAARCVAAHTPPRSPPRSPNRSLPPPALAPPAPAATGPPALALPLTPLSHRAAFFQRLGARLRHDLFSVAHDFQQDGLYVYKRPVRSGERRCGCRLLWQYGLLLWRQQHHIGCADHHCCIASPSGTLTRLHSTPTCRRGH